MKKFLSLISVIAVAVMFSSTLWAEVLDLTKTAYAEFGSVPIDVDVTLHQVPSEYTSGYYSGSPATATRIEFETANINVGYPEVVGSTGTVFAKIHTNLTGIASGSNLYMYTINQNNTDFEGNKYAVQPNAGRDIGDNNKVYNGLIRGNGQATEEETTTYNPGDYATISMYFCTTTDADTRQYHYDWDATDKKWVEGSVIPPVFVGDGTEYSGRKDLYDKNDNYEDLKSVGKTKIGQSGIYGGVWTGFGADDSTTYAGTKDVIVFFGANFSHVIGGDKYSTNTITFEIVEE